MVEHKYSSCKIANLSNRVRLAGLASISLGVNVNEKWVLYGFSCGKYTEEVEKYLLSGNTPSLAGSSIEIGKFDPAGCHSLEGQ
jgi:hypothetical protein